MNKQHYTNSGIKEHRTFSVNVPTANQVKETDYCGMVSGRKKDKSKLFNTFYGELQTAPMIMECPVNMECELIQTLNLPGFDCTCLSGKVSNALLRCGVSFRRNGRFRQG